MPRYARKQILSNLIHVMIQGINKEYIFNDEMEIYLKYLREKIQDTNIKVIAYCMMNNHAHFLFYFEDINEVSKLMKQVNTRYAIFYNKRKNRCGFVFRNRFKSEEIQTHSHLVTCIKYIHNNPVKAEMCKKASEYKYSSYNEYKRKRGILVDLKYIEENLKKFDVTIESILNEKATNELYRFMEDDDSDKSIFQDCILKDYMKKYKLNDITEIKENKKFLNEIVIIMYFKYNFSKQEISNMLNTSRQRIYKIINNVEDCPKC